MYNTYELHCLLIMFNMKLKKSTLQDQQRLYCSYLPYLIRIYNSYWIDISGFTSDAGQC